MDIAVVGAGVSVVLSNGTIESAKVALSAVAPTPLFVEAAGAALERPIDDLAAAAPMIDWSSMKHETQYTRLFRS